MGKSRVTVRTLASGERVRHYPSGDRVLIHENSVVEGQLEGEEYTARWLDAEKQYRRHRAVEKKVEKLVAGSVPSDKRPC